MEQSIGSKYQFWYKVFLVLGLLGLIDIATRSVIQQTYKVSDVGVLGVGTFFVFQYIFSTKIAGILSAVVSMILGLSLIWLILAYFMNRKAKVAEDPSEENVKKLKRAKIITGIFGLIFLAIILYTISLVL